MPRKKKATLQDEVRESAHKIWLAGLGALALAEEEGNKLFSNLVEKGQGFESRSKKQLEKVQDTFEGQVEGVRDRAEAVWGKVGKSFDEKVAEALQRLGVPSRMEIQKLTKRVEQLTKKVDTLKPKKPATRTAASRKTA